MQHLPKYEELSELTHEEQMKTGLILYWSTETDVVRVESSWNLFFMNLCSKLIYKPLNNWILDVSNSSIDLEV